MLDFYHPRSTSPGKLLHCILGSSYSDVYCAATVFGRFKVLHEKSTDWQHFCSVPWRNMGCYKVSPKHAYNVFFSLGVNSKPTKTISVITSWIMPRTVESTQLKLSMMQSGFSRFWSCTHQFQCSGPCSTCRVVGGLSQQLK